MATFSRRLAVLALGLAATGCAHRVTHVVTNGEATKDFTSETIILQHEGEEEPLEGPTDLKPGTTLIANGVHEPEAEDIEEPIKPATSSVLVSLRGGSRAYLAIPGEYHFASLHVRWGAALVRTKGDFRVWGSSVIADADDSDLLFCASTRDEALITVLSGTVILRSSSAAWPAMHLGPMDRVRTRAGRPGPLRRVRPEEFHELTKWLADLERAVGKRSDLIMPLIEGRRGDDARRILADHGLEGKSRTRLTTRPDEFGMVLDQDPSAGTRVGPDKRVDFGLGVQAVEVPSLLGQARADAEAELSRRDLRARVSKRMTGESRPGTVIDQDPRKGLVALGDEVELTVEAEWPNVPHVEGKKLDEALGLLRAAGFHRIDVETTRTDDVIARETVLRQDPRVGTPTPTTKTIRLLVAEHKAPPPPDDSRDPQIRPGSLPDSRALDPGEARPTPDKSRGPRIKARSLLDFGGVAPGKANRRQLTVTNAGDAPLHIKSIRTDNRVFTVHGRGFSLQPGQSRDIVVQFQPLGGLNYTGQLTIESNDARVPRLNVRLAGAGVVQ